MVNINEPMSEHKLILVKRRTRLEELIVRYNTVQQAQFYIERLGADFSDYIEEDRRYRQSIQLAQQQLSQLGRVQMIDREHVPNFIFGEQDIVVVVGQDGLVANTLKYVTEQPLIGVNPDPMRWDGVLLPFTVEDLSFIVPDVMRKQRALREVTLAKVELNDGQVLYGVNDLFIGRKTHVSARYEVRLGARSEHQSSSGIIVSTGMGSTGWFKSLLAGASGIVGSAAWQQLSRTGSGKRHRQPSQQEVQIRVDLRGMPRIYTIPSGSRFRAAPPQPVSYLDRFMPSSRCTLFHRCRRMELFSVTVWNRISWSSTLVCMPRSAWPRREDVS